MKKLILTRYEVVVGENTHGIFRIPQKTDLLNDEEYDRYTEYYEKLPFLDLGDAKFDFYFTEYGEYLQKKFNYVELALKALPYDFDLVKKVLEINDNDKRIFYKDKYQIAVLTEE